MSDKSNAFLDNGIQANDAVTENGALAHSTTGNDFVDDFASAGTFRNRTAEEIDKTMSKLWYADKLQAFKMLMYLRMVTRKVVINDTVTTEKVQKGQGLKDEAIKRLLWIAKNDKEWFYQNILLIPLVGSWRDVWQVMYMDQRGESIINRQRVYRTFRSFLNNSDINHDLFLKYMPLVKSKSKQKTPRAESLSLFAAEFRNVLKLSAKRMGAMKKNSSAHEFQQLISTKRFKDIKFKEIPGKALTLLTSSKFLNNNNLEQEYLNFIQAQPTAKFTGYPYELSKKLRERRSLSLIEEITINKQFDHLVQLAKADGVEGLNGNVWCAADTSGSMEMHKLEDGTTPFDICVSLSLYFSALNEGSFKDHIIMFDTKSTTVKLTGKTFTDKYRQITGMRDAMGGTNFQSVVDEICRVRRQNPMIPISDFPETLLVVSDMQFNLSSRPMYYWGTQDVELPSQNQIDHNYNSAMAKLRAVGLPDIKIIWWQVRPSAVKNFPSNINDKGTYAFSGFDGSVLSLLLGAEAKVNDQGEKIQLSMEETMQLALNQSVMEHITVPKAKLTK